MWILEQVLSMTRDLDEKALFASNGETKDLKNMSSSILFTQVNCLQQQRRSKVEMNKTLAFAGLDVALVAGTLGLGSGIVGAKMAATAAVRAGGTASKTRMFSSAFPGLAVIGADMGASTPFMHEAFKQCDSLLNQIESLGKTQQKADVCESMPLKAKHTSDLKGCMLQAGLASLPAVLGIGALAGGVAIGARVASREARTLGTAAEEIARRRNQAEDVLNKKLTDEQAEAVQRTHLVGAMDELGKDGINPPGIGNYTEAQLRQKNQILKTAGFSPADRRKLMETGVVGRPIFEEALQNIPASDIAKMTRDELQEIPPASFASFTKPQVEALGDNVKHLTPPQLVTLGDNVKHLTPPQLVTLGDSVQHFTPQQVTAIGDNVSAFTENQLVALGDSVTGLTPPQVTVIGDKARNFTSDQVERLGDSVSGLTLPQAASLMDKGKFPILSRRQTKMLRPDVRSEYVKKFKFDIFKALAIGKASIVGGLSLGILTKLLEKQAQGKELIDEEAKVVQQVQAMRDIPVSDIAKMTQDELQKIHPEVFPFFTDQQLNAINVNHLTPEQRKLIDK